MTIDNYFIADQFSLLSKLMDIHGENSFKTKSYSIAAFNIEKLPEQLADISQDKIFAIKGIGDAIGKKIIQIIETGELPLLKEYFEKTPPGLIEMLGIKNIGPKKISTIWKEMQIESVGELLYACNENRLMLYKGFGEKTQKNIQESIEFFFKNQGSYLYSQAEPYALDIDEKLKKQFPNEKFELAGEFKRQLEIITKVEWLTTTAIVILQNFFHANNFTIENHSEKDLTVKHPDGIILEFHYSAKESFYKDLFQLNSSSEFLQSWNENTNWNEAGSFNSEEDIFSSVKINFIPSYLRENGEIIEKGKKSELPAVIKATDIKSIIHSHSNWSDGSNTVEEMANHCIEKGYEYFVISDHSKSAFYANGLTEERIKEQHIYIDELNRKLSPFRIFKSIECDILNDGTLDYTDNILSTFDLIIASVHSNLKMTEEKAMMRLLRAIENPYTTILGHMTGRLLLSRKGYPVDHKKIIDACAANNVVIELNAHPRRLDMDWRWIEHALEKNVMISIDPDAHSLHGYEDVKYGVLAAQKAGLTKEKNLSSFNLKEFENFLSKKKK
ncbi:MAG TPA: helix-hairpin-helix domain-containing protein [Puia sp.]|jgi:DNA polymerase (family 10)|nr:helix-hairpin-helix domain-containing protein [Puia sp.]